MMRSSVFFMYIGLLLASAAASAQQGVTRPVLSAAPVQQPAAPPPTPVNGPVVPGGQTPAQSSGPDSMPTPAVTSPGYLIGPEDNLQVTVWKEPNLSGPLSVRPDGMISLPLVGDVLASGMTPTALGADVATRLKKYINDPLVTISVLAINSKHVFLLGEVQRIGPLAITPGLTILQAISSAGGLTPYANSKHIYILRGESGSQQKIPFNYKKAVKDGNLQGVTLQPGDTIFVP